jgi:U3 small nucleolar RNA-associated protein 22
LQSVDIYITPSTLLRVDISTAKPRTNFTSNIHDYPSSVACSIESVASIVRQALGTRARLVAVVRQSSSLRDITASHPSQTSVFHLGIILDPSQATRLVDHGPSAEDADGTEKFRELWGDVAELRRFKDGSILESVVWDCPNAFVQRNDIPGRIVEHILKRHFNIDPTYVTVYNRMYDSVLTMPADITRAYLAATDAGTSGFRSALNAYDSLVKTLQAMELPLSLQSLSPSAEGLRQSSVFPPMPLDLDRYSALPHCANFVPTMDFILQFEKSSKWPDDLRAIQKVKLAFFETIAQSLQKQFPDATISIRIDNSITELADNSSLEILLSSGFAFRGMIHHDRELILLERTIGDAVGTDRREREFAINLHKSRFRLSPRHHAAIAALNHRYPSFSLATRLVKRWFSAHYVAPHIPTEMLELLCASIYLNVGPNGIPKSGPTAFAQTIKLLQEWSWRERPLLVPLYSATAAESDNGVAFPSDKKVLVEDAFKATRIRDPTMARSSWIIATEEDIAGEAWGITEPGWFVAQRVTQLAKASWECIEIGISAGTLNVPVGPTPSIRSQ